MEGFNANFTMEYSKMNVLGFGLGGCNIRSFKTGFSETNFLDTIDLITVPMIRLKILC